MLLTVGELEAALFSAFPRSDAESWDQPGLAVGDRDEHVEKVAFNLDMTAAAVIAAHKAGCNVLVTHHPPFIKSGPTEFGPQVQETPTGPGRLVYEAVRRGVNVIAMHTNADRAVALRECYARMLECKCLGNFEHLMDAQRSADETGFGALLQPTEDPEVTISLEELASRCMTAFGRSPRVWGSPDRQLKRIAVLNGSWGEPELYDICVREGIDCMVVGETKYHLCVDAHPHLTVIDLGHDVSEMPIVNMLHETVAKAGVDEELLVDLDVSGNNWWTPGTEL